MMHLLCGYKEQISSVPGAEGGVGPVGVTLAVLPLVDVQQQVVANSLVH